MLGSAAQKLFEAQEYDQCLAFIEPHLATQPAKPILHGWYGACLFQLGKYEESLAYFKIALRLGVLDCPFEFYLMARTAVLKSPLPQELRVKFWSDSTDPASFRFETAKNALLAGKFEEATQDFEGALSDAFSDAEVRAIWMSSMRQLTAAIRGEKIDAPPQPARLKKLIVSGYGWSGSGAVFDYLSEFGDVQAIHGEALHIDSPDGVLGLVANRENTQGFVWAALNFFFYTLLGRGELKGGHHFNVFEKTQRFMNRADPVEYAGRVNAIVHALSFCIWQSKGEGKISHDSLCDVAELVANRILCGEAEAGKHVLLDNVIHSFELHLVAYLRDTTIFCSVRDPRSNYLALRREDPGYADTVDQFIVEKGKLLRKTLQILETIDRQIGEGQNVQALLVQFEHFVTSEEFRSHLAWQAGLNASLHQKHRSFRPWESARNVMLHEEHGDPADMKKIIDALPEFCIRLTFDTLAPRGLSLPSG